MLSKKTDFVGDIFIANLNESCEGLEFYQWMELQEENCLRMTLGNCVTDELYTQLQWNDNTYEYELIDTAEDKWSWLLYGHTYTDDDINTSSITYDNCGCGCNNMNCDTYKWEGIINIIERNIEPTKIGCETANGFRIRQSYLFYYIFWVWSQGKDSISTSTGEKIIDVKNATSVSNSSRRINAHNKFVSWIIECDSNGRVGLYRFMQDFSDLFPQWQGTCLKYEPIW